MRLTVINPESSPDDYSDIKTRGGQQHDTATKTKTRATNNQQIKLNDKIYPMEN